MNKTSGTAEQILSLPKGGGAVQGLGETFQPDFHTGTGSYAIPIDIPNGPNDIAPKLSLFYHTGAGNGPFGMGFGLNILTIQRSMNKRIPIYCDDDPLILMGDGEIVDTGGGKYRLKVDTRGWQIEREGEGFRITDNEGKYYRLGITENSRIFNQDGDSKKTLSWHLEETEDALGYKVRYSYLRDGNNLYLERIDYSIYTIRFNFEKLPDGSYKERPDIVVNGRAGFIITTRLRYKNIELLLNTSTSSLVRCWNLNYIQSAVGGHSLLQQVKLSGFDDKGGDSSLPVLTMDYTAFHPRLLERFDAEMPEAAPGLMDTGQRELIDWDGDGLPDLLEIGGGNACVWFNKGDCKWSIPQSIGNLPVPVALDQPGTAFADMEGNGTADLIMLDCPLSGYYPHKPKGGFDPPVLWTQVPNVPLSDPNVRLVDLNGDGITDMIVTGENSFNMYYRQQNTGWTDAQSRTRPQVPPVSFSDPNVHLADMNGDGLQDLVVVNGSGVIYWPYLGNRVWGESISLKNPPALPRQYEPKRMFLADIDGDGCADLIYIDLDQVIYWLNGGGTMLSDPHFIADTPPVPLNQIRIADMKGSGTLGILWSYIEPTGHKTDYFYLDFTGGVKPYLLNRIDNGMGLITEIEYGTSVAEATRDKLCGETWKTFSPFPVHVITAMSIKDQATSNCSLSKYRYHQGHYDGIDREFVGFGITDIEEIGDEAISTMLTRNWHHIGLEPENPARPLSDIQRARLKALRGKLLKTEIYGLDGGTEQDKLYMRTDSKWEIEVLEVVNGIEVLVPRQTENRTQYLERKATPYRVIFNRNVKFDEYGNVTEQEQHTEDPRNPALNRVLHTVISFAGDKTERFCHKPSKVVQRDGRGKIIAATISYYDGLPEGQIGVSGLLSRQETLVVTDEIISQVYGENVPDFQKLGYHKRDGEEGWWVDQVIYTRMETADKLQGTVTNAKGSMSKIFFDIHKIQPCKIVDALGNAMEAQIDYRANKLQALTDANGIVISNQYDPIGRLIYTVESGSSIELPKVRHNYLTESIPVAVVTEERTVNGENEILRRKVFLDGYGQVLEERMVSDTDEIVRQSQLYSVRKLVKKQFLPYEAVSPEYTIPSTALPHRKFRYDSIGRLVEIINSDGSGQKQRFEPGAVFIYDEEDIRVGGSHENTPTRHTYDPTGRIMEVSVNEEGRWISINYEYDVKGNLLAVVNAGNQRMEFTYDLLGHRLCSYSPESGKSVFLFDANGNQVERRNAGNEAVHFEFDELDRLNRVILPAMNEVSAEYVYHDTDRPALTEGCGYSKGRIVKIAHQGGVETFGYDALGRVIHKEIYPSGMQGKKLEFDYTYRARGEIDTVTYPDAGGGKGRLIVRYEYDKRGMLKCIPNYIRQIDYNVAGQRTRIEYVNDVVTAYVYNMHNFRLEEMLTSVGAGSVLQDFRYQYDQAGNLIKVDSPDPKIEAKYTYDDLYRLKEVSTLSGKEWSYQYDDLGNLTFKSGVGSYTYDSQGLLVTAGAEKFSHTVSGQVSNTTKEEYYYDSIGHLKSVVRGSEQMLCTYNHEGRRIRRQIIGVENPQDILNLDEMISIENGSIVAYIMDASIRVAKIELGMAGVSFLHGDHLGGTTLMTGPTGKVLQRIYYDPFGTVLENAITTESEGTLFLYTGQCWDDWAALFYMGARYYNPKLGRFMTPDTIIPEMYNPQAWNRYSYVQNNPMSFMDPTGHFLEEIGGFFREKWKYLVAGAVIVVGVITAPAGGIGVMAIGGVIGGVIGGISANAAGGDVLLGVLVGMAVGGAAGVAGTAIEAKMSAIFKATLFTKTILTGTLSGAVNGAAIGLAAGFAGGQGNAGLIWEMMWKGALVGAFTGLVVGVSSYCFGKGWLGTGNVDIAIPSMKDFQKAAMSCAQGDYVGCLRSVLANFIKIGGNSGVPLYSFLNPTYTGAVASIFAQSTSGLFLVLDYTDNLRGLRGYMDDHGINFSANETNNGISYNVEVT